MQFGNILSKFDQVNTYWQPHIVADLNNQQVKIAKLKGEFIWHEHQNEDELFWVIKGELVIKFRTHEITLKENDYCCIPRATEHLPIAKEEAWVVLFEPNTTLNTGNINNDLTQRKLKKI